MFALVSDRCRAEDSLSHFGVLPALHFIVVTLPTNSLEACR